MSRIFIGIDLGGTNIKIGFFDSELNLVGRTSVGNKADAKPGVVVDKIGAAIENFLADKGVDYEKVGAVGIGSTGQFNLSEGFMISNPNLTLFQNVPFRKMLSERLGKTVVLENDGNAACWGEHACGAGKGIDDMVFFTLGTGIGGGIISKGELVHGSADNGAELGHLIIYPDGRICGCGQRGCVEAYASAKSTAKRASEAVEGGAKSSLKKSSMKTGR
jgi:Transcriptional regulator/sugar kinase